MIRSLRLAPLLLMTSCAWTPSARVSPPTERPSTTSPSIAIAGPVESDVLADETSAATSTAVSLDGVPDEDADEGEAAVAEEEEVAVPSDGDPDRLRYTLDLSEEDLIAKWRNAPDALGSISIGFAHEGRLINSKAFPRGDGGAWVVVSPENTWATSESIDYVIAAAEHVKALHPNAFPLRVNQMSSREGGYLRPHRSHQNGRDVDLGFYYPTATPSRVREREKIIDVAQNWDLVKALVTLTDVQIILVDRRVAAVLYAHALSVGEDRAWLDSLFYAEKDAIIQHAPRHRDHFHVRFFNGRAQELGRRVAPLLAERPEHNVAIVRVKKGDTLGAIALKHKSSVRAIQKANRMKGTFLRLAQVLKVPMRGPCTRCPVPPATMVPPRRLPPVVPAEVTIPPAQTSTDAISLSSSVR